MERIALGCELGGFVLLDAISHIDPENITGYRHFEGAESFLGIEALAQLGAYHVRYLCGFEKHAFLLGVKRCAIPNGRHISGTLRLGGQLTSRSTSAFSYNLQAVCENKPCMEGDFLFSVVEYDETYFKKEVLREHYRKVFSCLRNGSSKDWLSSSKPASIAIPR
jgi:hypothetical protein